MPAKKKGITFGKEITIVLVSMVLLVGLLLFLSHSENEEFVSKRLAILIEKSAPSEYEKGIVLGKLVAIAPFPIKTEGLSSVYGTQLTTDHEVVVVTSSITNIVLGTEVRRVMSGTEPVICIHGKGITCHFEIPGA